MPFSQNYFESNIPPVFSVDFCEGWEWSQRSGSQKYWENIPHPIGTIKLFPEEWLWNANEAVGFWAKLNINIEHNSYTDLLCILHTSIVMDRRDERPLVVLIFSNGRISLVPSDFHPSGYIVDWPRNTGAKGFGYLTDTE